MSRGGNLEFFRFAAPGAKRGFSSFDDFARRLFYHLSPSAPPLDD